MYKRFLGFFIFIVSIFISATPSIKKDCPNTIKYIFNKNNYKTILSYQKLNTYPILPGTLKGLLRFTGIDKNKIFSNSLYYPVNLYKIVYKTKYRGKYKKASGLCTIPEINFPANLKFPLLCYQHGTIFHEKNIPSNYKNILSTGLETGLNILFSSAGFICSAPDYLGYGESKDIVHPYMIKEHTSKACMGMLEAVLEFCQIINLNFNQKLYLTGYSEGGYATIGFYNYLLSNLNNNYQIKAVSAGSASYHLDETAKMLAVQSSIPAPAFYCYTIYSYLQTYGWNRDLKEIFNPPYCERIKNIFFNRQLTTKEINSKLTNDLHSLLTPKFINDYRGDGELDLKKAFKENSIYILKGNSKCSIRFFHGESDLTIPVSNSKKIFRIIKSNNPELNCDLFLFPGLNHQKATIKWALETMLWFNHLKQKKQNLKSVSNI